MEATSLREIYASIDKDANTVYVVPLIRYSHKKTDYLYLLYEDLIKSDAYEIKSVSIFNHFNLIAGIISNKKAILHYHWLEFQDFRSLLGMPWKLICIYLFQKLGGSIVWTIHNEFPHDQKYLRFHSFLYKKIAHWADVLHVHCETAVKKMSSRLQVPTEKFKLVPHPTFPAEAIPKHTARNYLNETYGSQLNSEIPVFLMFGNISRYKQINQVADLIIGTQVECKLLVVGPVKKGNMSLYEELSAKSGEKDRIQLIPNFIPENHVPWFYSAADICVFNYREILSSGGFHMAKAYNKTIIAPNLGCLSEEKETPNVFLFDDAEGLENLLKEQLIPFGYE
ncbi:MAG: glycosyltransferase family 4 protein [Gracilimonas sp.]|uniref:hypothetical protein n=1 Tax=Gracilimonas sp. TaxID=1974203 RepID=UPI0019A1E866|nr:hypothetical protein [Gracilimonas sp.]MBD3615788.1 glycosyltransferase family 4 protein [Gracilimonas sp.]